MTEFAVSQLLAAIAFTLGAMSFQFKGRKTVLLFWFFSAAFNASHFLILEHTTSAVLVAVTAIRFLCAAYKPNDHYKYIFITLAAISFSLTFDGYLSLIGLLATLIGTIGSFNKDELKVRVYMMAVSLLWTSHNALAGSPVATIMEACFFISNFVAMKRLQRNNYFSRN